MFKAVNTESDAIKKKTQVEKERIKELYLTALRTMKFDMLFNFKVSFETNQEFFNCAKSNLMYNYVKKTEIKKLLENLEKINFLEHKNALFEFVRKNIETENYVAARKLLNKAKDNGWYCNDYYDYNKRIECEYFGIIKM
jgi:hypothetical protein